MLDLIYFLLIGLAAGWLAGQIFKGHDFGLVLNMVIGCIGALVGGFLVHLIGFHQYGIIANLITATIGALVLLFVAQKLKK